MENIEKDYNDIATAIASLLVKIQSSIIEENSKSENGEKVDVEYLKKLKASAMHCSHAIGELIESKAILIDDLSAADNLIIEQYENEMDMALDNFGKTILFSDILKDFNDE